MIDKGYISSLNAVAATAEVVPMTAGAAVTHDLIVPRSLRGSLSVGLPVVYATFADHTGIILARADGES